MAADVTSLDFDPKNSVLKVNDGSSLQDISPNIVGIEFPSSWKNVDVTRYGSAGMQWSPGIDETKFTVDLLFNQVTTTGSHTVVGAMHAAKAKRAWEYYPAGTTSGNLKLSGNAYCPSYRITGRVGDKVRVTAEFHVDNGVTFGTAT